MSMCIPASISPASSPPSCTSSSGIMFLFKLISSCFICSEIAASAMLFMNAIHCADWLQGLILDGIVAGVGAVLGFVPQMLVLFLFLAFLESCGYMARVALRITIQSYIARLFK